MVAQTALIGQFVRIGAKGEEEAEGGKNEEIRTTIIRLQIQKSIRLQPRRRRHGEVHSTPAERVFSRRGSRPLTSEKILTTGISRCAWC